MERWLPVVGFEGAYEVSDLGRVRSLDRQWQQMSKGGNLYTHKVQGKMLRPGRMTAGHLSVALGRGQSKCVHSLVLEAFVGPRPSRFEARHLNGDEADNRLDNLQWSSRGDNGRDKKWHNGALTYKLTPEQVRKIKVMLKARCCTQRKIASLFDVSEYTISCIKHGKVHTDVRLGD
jgi:predicted XRE-type DNA-binding protein